MGADTEMRVALKWKGCAPAADAPQRICHFDRAYAMREGKETWAPRIAHRHLPVECRGALTLAPREDGSIYFSGYFCGGTFIEPSNRHGAAVRLARNDLHRNWSDRSRAGAHPNHRSAARRSATCLDCLAAWCGPAYRIDFRSSFSHCLWFVSGIQSHPGNSGRACTFHLDDPLLGARRDLRDFRLVEEPSSEGQPLPERPPPPAFPWLDFLLMPERASGGHGHVSPLVLLITLVLRAILYIFLHPRRQERVAPAAEERTSVWSWKLFLEQLRGLFGSIFRHLHEVRVRAVWLVPNRLRA
jgi:hypothetical protein